MESIYNIQSGKSSDHLGKGTKCDHKYRKPMPLMISWPTDIDSISRPQLDHPIHNDKHQQQQMLAQVSAPTFSIFTSHFWHPFLFCKFNWYVPPCHCEYPSPRTQLVSDSLNCLICNHKQQQLLPPSLF